MNGLVILLCFLASIALGYGSLRNFIIIVRDKKFVGENVLKTLHDLSIIKCGMECGARNNCLGFNYETTLKNSNSCQLLNTKSPLSNELHITKNSNYYEEDCSRIISPEHICPNNGTPILNPLNGFPLLNTNASCKPFCKCSPPYRKYNCEEYCPFTVQIGKNVPGRFDLGSSGVKDLQGCIDKCLKKEKCLGFMYYRSYTYCYLKSESVYTLKAADFVTDSKDMEYYSMFCD